ncbi:hypothetical protein M422DRAFT_211748 [Sphaerobolus stellatus SS14]|uniref:Pre-mRNA-splicing factor SYF2 n=1 Tax=Sphaerobolus stellatus (strain SS14) TaxID=990650 RepID=A0A0C9V645_SPHS4|nr:hypothetical protein M422DRAFT_211748 [Sphaerobolus stellatus SS14]
MEVAQAAVEGAKDVAAAASDFVETMNEGESQGLTLEERMEKMKQLRSRMRQAEKDNRADLVTESQKSKQTARDAVRLERQRKLQDLLRLKADADDRGQDFERAKNWEYTIEENDLWEKKLKRKKGRADFEFHDDGQAAQRKYKKDLDLLKPDLNAYNAQKEAALGYAPGTLTAGASSSSSALILNQAGPVTTEQKIAAENLYRDANSLLYADNKPTEDAIDRVVQKLNLDLDKRGNRSRKRANEDEGDVTYINERNRVFNKKIARYYDKYTTEIRASFERGTAL